MIEFMEAWASVDHDDILCDLNMVGPLVLDLIREVQFPWPCLRFLLLSMGINEI
jgi:hypothetical protein